MNRLPSPTASQVPSQGAGALSPRALFPRASAPDARPTVGVLALQGDVREHAAALEAAGARPVAVRRADQLVVRDGLADPGLDALVLPGGESTTMSRLLRSFGMLAPLRELVGAGLPVLGSCAGMVLLADRVDNAGAGQEQVGGLDVTVRRNAFGRQVDSYEEDIVAPLLGAGPDNPLHAVFIRAPWVAQAGPGVEILATTRAGRAGQEGDGARGRIVAVRQGSVLATSFHPEVGGDHRIHDLFVAMAARPS